MDALQSSAFFPPFRGGKERKGKVTDLNFVNIDSFVLLFHLLVCNLHSIHRRHLSMSDHDPGLTMRVLHSPYSLGSPWSWKPVPYSTFAVEAASIDPRTFSFASMYVVPVVEWPTNESALVSVFVKRIACLGIRGYTAIQLYFGWWCDELNVPSLAHPSAWPSAL